MSNSLVISVATVNILQLIIARNQICLLFCNNSGGSSLLLCKHLIMWTVVCLYMEFKLNKQRVKIYSSICINQLKNNDWNFARNCIANGLSILLHHYLCVLYSIELTLNENFHFTTRSFYYILSDSNYLLINFSRQNSLILVKVKS